MRKNKNPSNSNPRIFWVECFGCKDIVKVKDFVSATLSKSKHRLCPHCGYIHAKEYLQKNKFKK